MHEAESIGVIKKEQYVSGFVVRFDKVYPMYDNYYTKNLEIIKAQLETIIDVTKYIHEQSLTLRNPEEITFQLDTLLQEVEETQATVVEMEEVFANPMDLLSEMDLFEDPASDEDELREEGSRVQEQ